MVWYFKKGKDFDNLKKTIEKNFQTWLSELTTKVLFKHGDEDFYDFYESFNHEGFYLLINLAEGGDMPGMFVLVFFF